MEFSLLENRIDCLPSVCQSEGRAACLSMKKADCEKECECAEEERKKGIPSEFAMT